LSSSLKLAAFGVAHSDERSPACSEARHQPECLVEKRQELPWCSLAVLGIGRVPIGQPELFAPSLQLEEEGEQDRQRKPYRAGEIVDQPSAMRMPPPYIGCLALP
jgi:hypothetical protein